MSDWCDVTEKFDLKNALQSAKAIVPRIIQQVRTDNGETPQMTLEKVEGGITNTLFKCEFQQSGSGQVHPPILIRIFGGEGIVDRNRDNVVFRALSAAGLGPGCYGTFANGRVEHFLQGYRTMNYHDIGELENAKMIAREMARVHKWHAEEIVAFDGSKEPVLFSQIWKWHDQAVAVDPASFEPEDCERMKKLEIFKAKDELTFLEKSIPEGCKTAFCNNDLLCGNVMQDVQTGKIMLIDFEYGGFNYCAFDIGNHFNMYAGGTDQGPMLFPSPDHVRAFCGAYLEESEGAAAESIVGFEAKSSVLCKDVNLFVLISHWYWALWAVNMAATKGNEEFNYFIHAQKHLDEFWRKRHLVHDLYANSPPSAL